MVDYPRPRSANSHPPSKYRPLLKVEVCRWPYPLSDQIKAQALLDSFRDHLPIALNVSEWRKRPVHKKPNNGAKLPQAPTTVARTMAAALAGEPDCWISSFTLGVCLVNGEEIPCRIEYWECEDGTGFERHELLGVQALGNGSDGAAPAGSADGSAPNLAVARANAQLPDGTTGDPSHA